MAVVLMILAGFLFVAGYVFYGGYIARRLGIDPQRPTPAHELRDGVDYEPAAKPVLLGHHFASIAGAAPIIGPVTAAVFGWVPVFLWIILGGIFMGAVHDFTSLVASLRHRGKSIGTVIEEEIGYTGKILFLLFSWAALVLVIAVFAVIVAQTFVSVPQCATASTLFLIIAVGWGLMPKRNITVATLIGLVFMALALMAGQYYPLRLDLEAWLALLFVYVFVASVTPVWVLLQPRDYLNAYLLYGALLLAFVGILAAAPAVKAPAFVGFVDVKLGPIFPILFVTVACGAISGFHSLVASGTVAKQMNSEADAKSVGFGAMLIESFLAVVALLAAVTFVREDYVRILLSEGPVAVFSQGIGGFAARLGLPEQVAVTFLALAVSAFALTSLDTATRLGRFAWEEFFRREDRPAGLLQNRFLATIATVIPAALLAFTGHWQAIWPIFGSANQLLAALALLTVSIWLINQGKKPVFTLVPMVLMMAVTLSALTVLVYENYVLTGNFLLGSVGLLLFAIAVFLVIYAWWKIRKAQPTPPATPTSSAD
ncbi:MAG: carbon starvation protein A [Acidobacteria bacterium]|nr:carbon starvation protein A [Acidobacteriota bacterium]